MCSLKQNDIWNENLEEMGKASLMSSFIQKYKPASEEEKEKNFKKYTEDCAKKTQGFLINLK